MLLKVILVVIAEKSLNVWLRITNTVKGNFWRAQQGPRQGIIHYFYAVQSYFVVIEEKSLNVWLRITNTFKGNFWRAPTRAQTRYQMLLLCCSKLFCSD